MPISGSEGPLRRIAAPSRIVGLTPDPVPSSKPGFQSAIMIPPGTRHPTLTSLRTGSFSWSGLNIAELLPVRLCKRPDPRIGLRVDRLQPAQDGCLLEGLA